MANDRKISAEDLEYQQLMAETEAYMSVLETSLQRAEGALQRLRGNIHDLKQAGGLGQQQEAAVQPEPAKEAPSSKDEDSRPINRFFKQ